MPLTVSFLTRRDVLCPVCDRPLQNNVAAFYSDHLLCPECWRLHSDLLNAALLWIHGNAGSNAFTSCHGLLVFTPDRYTLEQLRRAARPQLPISNSNVLPQHRPHGAADDHNPHAATAALRVAQTSEHNHADARRDQATS